jgi:hypothetical protein
MTHAELVAALSVFSPETAITFRAGELLDAIREAPLVRAPEPEQPETWLTAKQVAEMLGTSARWAFDHQRELGGRKLSRKCVRFSSRSVRRYLAKRHA